MKCSLFRFYRLMSALEIQSYVYRTSGHDQKVSKDFQNVSGKPFVSGSVALGLIMNIDWFQPYKHTDYFVGTRYMYATIMNLPKSVRFK